MPPDLTYSEVAKLAHRSVRTVKRWASKKTPSYRRLKVHRVTHSTILISPAAWEAFKERAQ